MDKNLAHFDKAFKEIIKQLQQEQKVMKALTASFSSYLTVQELVY